MVLCKYFSGNILFFIFLSSLITVPAPVHSKMYLWKDEKGGFNASEEKPGWWPRESNCIAWVPGRKNKVVDLVETNKKITICELDTKEKKKEVKRIVRKKVDEEPVRKKEIIEPTDKEIRIYCAYRKDLLRFLDVAKPEELSVRDVMKRFEISEEEFNEINSKVVDYKGGDYRCAF
jgi:hypothetical protein